MSMSTEQRAGGVWFAFRGLVAAAAAAFVLTSAPAAGQTAPARTFSKDIAPILQRSCQNCHRPGSVAPMSLLTYQEVRPWVRAIKQKTGSREMPPWFIEKNVGIQQFKDDLSLSDAEIATIAHGRTRGAAGQSCRHAAAPRVRRRLEVEHRHAGPHRVLARAHAESGRRDWYGLLDLVAHGLTEDRYIKAVEVKEVRLKDVAVKRQAGDLSLFVVHHAVISARQRLPDDVIVTQTGAGTPCREPSWRQRRLQPHLRGGAERDDLSRHDRHQAAGGRCAHLGFAPAFHRRGNAVSHRCRFQAPSPGIQTEIHGHRRAGSFLRSTWTSRRTSPT